MHEALGEWLYRTPIQGSTPEQPEDEARVREFLERYLAAQASELHAARDLAMAAAPGVAARTPAPRNAVHRRPTQTSRHQRAAGAPGSPGTGRSTAASSAVLTTEMCGALRRTSAANTARAAGVVTTSGDSGEAPRSALSHAAPASPASPATASTSLAANTATTTSPSSTSTSRCPRWPTCCSR